MRHANVQPNQVNRKGWSLIGLICVALLWSMIGLSGCASRVFYTDDYRVKVDSAHITPSSLQFYNDKEFLIRRRIETKSVSTEEGVITSSEALRVQDFRIRRGTPCRVDSVSGNSYFIRFELGEGNVVRFYKNSFGYYQIGADKWVRGRGSIQYGGKDCEIERVGNDCLLLVKNYQSFRDKKERRVVDGLKVGYQKTDTIVNDEETDFKD